MRANFANTTGCSQVGQMSYRNGPSAVHVRLCDARLPLRRKTASPNRLGGENAEQVKVCGLLVVENAHLVPGARSGIEDLEAVGGLDQAHGAVDLFADRVGGRRYRREACEFREDPLGCLAPELGTSATGVRLTLHSGRRGLGEWPGRIGGPGRLQDTGRGRAPGRRLERQLRLTGRRAHGELRHGGLRPGLPPDGGLWPGLPPDGGLWPGLPPHGALRASLTPYGALLAGLRCD